MKAYGLAIAATIATFVLLLVGALVNPTGSSLACPDWPLCFGSLFPEMTGGVEYEHTHRLVATLVGLLTWALAFTMWRSSQIDQRLKTLGLVAAVMVVVQGVLGGVTVLLKLPTLVSTGHLAVSMIFFSLLILITYRLRRLRNGLGDVESESSGGGPMTLLVITGVAVYLQVVLGALVRHTQSALACGDSIPFCAGALWPTWGPGQVHMAHRIAAVFLFFLIVVTSVYAARYATKVGSRPLAVLAIAAPILTLVQIFLGVITVTSLKALHPVTAHVGVGTLLLADFVLMVLVARSIPAGGLPKAEPTEV